MLQVRLCFIQGPAFLEECLMSVTIQARLQDEDPLMSRFGHVGNDVLSPCKMSSCNTLTFKVLLRVILSCILVYLTGY